MYANKRRQRNFKRIREASKPGLATNPSKRHRERLNSELEIVAELLPYEQNVISRLDKLSVLRLAVSYLQIKAHFQACLHRYIANFPFAFAHSYPFIPTNDTAILYGGGVPTAIHHSSGQSLIDPNEHEFESMALKALGGFILILNENGDIYYVSENIETYLGFHQSDILHQSLFEMIHSEDREDMRLQLAWNYNVPLHVSCLQDILTPGGMPYLERNVNARFRCLLDNTCGFLRIDVRGKLMSLHGLPHSYVLNRVENHSSGNIVLGLVAVCSPFVPPNVADQQQLDDPILKTKHSLDFTLVSTDNRMKALLELDDKNLPHSFYSLVHVDDATSIAEAHKEVTKNSASGILIYRLISVHSQRIYWIQSSCRMFYKNGKPETIGLTHRLLTEVEGTMLLEKRTSLRAKLLSFDDSLLQSPGNLQSTAALPSTSCDTTSLSLYMTGSDRNRSAISKRHNTQFSTMPAKSRQLLPAQINRNLSTQSSVATAEIQQQQQHLSTRGRKRKKQNINDNQPCMLSVPHYPTFMMPSTSNDLKEIQMQDERQQHITIAATATAARMNTTRIPRIIQNSQSENLAATTTAIHGVSGTNASMIPGLFQLPQDLSNFSGLTAYFSTDNSTGTVRHDQSYQWSSSTKTNYWPSSSDLYYQNYMTNNANYATTISSGFYPSQMDQNNLVLTRNRVEYPTLFSANDLTCAGSTYTPTPAQLLLSSSELLQPPTTVQSTNAMFKSTVLFETPENSITDQTFSATISDYTQSMQMITGDNAGAGANSSNTSGSTGFNLISEVTNALLG